MGKVTKTINSLPLTLFVIKLLLVLVIAALATKIIPYLGFFPYIEQLKAFNLPPLITSLANFDGIHYLRIAQSGYAQYEQAFFPLYPILIRLFSPLFFNNYLITSLAISNTSFLLGLFFIFRFLQLVQKRAQIHWALIFLLAFPTAFFFCVAYTEALFFLMLSATLYYAKVNKVNIAAFFAFLASLTRLTGLFLVIVLFFSQYKSGNVIRKIWLILTPVLGLLIYMGYLYKTTGDPLFFFTSQPAFGANRSTSLVLLPQVYFRYFKIFITADLSFAYFVAFTEILLFSLVFITSALYLYQQYKKQNLFLMSVALFSVLNIYLPTLTGTFSSTPRYALASIASFIFLANIKNISIKILLLTISVALQAVLLGFFIQGYFVS